MRLSSSLLVVVAILPVGCTTSKTHPRDSGTHAPSASHEAAHPHAHEGDAGHRFADAEKWAAVFEDPERDAWQKPDEVIAALRLSPDARVADIGAATGYFPVRIARAHPTATVYGVDSEPNMVRYLDERARREALPNVKAVQGEAADPRLPESVDLVLLVNTYHHVENRPAYFRRLATSLRSGGRLAIIDFRPGAPIGPEHKLPKEDVVRELADAGYRVATEHTFLPNQYFLVFERAEAVDAGS